MHTRSVFALCVAVMMLRAGAAHAHHDTILPLPLTLNDAGAIGQIADARNRTQTSVGISSRFMQLEGTAQPSGLPSVLITGEDSSLLVSQLELGWSPKPQLAFSLSLPMVVAVPENDETQAGPGDMRVGAWWNSRPETATAWRHAAGLDVSAPTGEADHGFGTGAFLTRVAASVGRGFGHGHLQIDLESGLSWAWRSQTSLAVDYGSNAMWRFTDRVAAGLLVRGRTFLQDSGNDGLGTYAGEGQSAGSTVAVFMPGVSIMATEFLRLTAGPQIPIGYETFSLGFAVGVRYQI